MAASPDPVTSVLGDPQWAALLSETYDIVTVIGADRRQIWVSPALERVLGYRSVPETFPAGYVHPDDVARITAAFDRLVATGDAVTVEYRVRHADGRWRWVEATGRNRLDDPRIRAVIAVTRDITERRQPEGRLRSAPAPEYRAALADMMEQSPHPAVIHCDGIVRWTNRATAELFQIELTSAPGRQLSEFVPAESRDLVAQRVASVLESGKVQAGEVVLQTPAGERVVVETRATRTTWEGRPAVHLVMWDVTQRRAQADQLAWDASHDALTGLPNRVRLGERLRGALAGLRRDPGIVWVLFIDLDGYKTVNDTLGHLTGDEVLRTVAQRLAGAVRPGDTVARYGGDEFVAVGVHPPDAGVGSIEKLAGRLRAAVAAPVAVGGAEVCVTASLGWAVTTNPDADPVELLRAADHDVYRAKRASHP